MDTLLIRLIGPQQAWGVQSAGENRDTGLEPSKSGVIGLLCAALGRPRQQPLDDLNALRMGVRVEREGRLESDFQTIHRISWEGETSTGSISTRFYLSDAAFLVGLEGDPSLIETLQEALAHPHWLIYLGRKAFPPSLPVRLPDGLRHGQTLEETLRTYPWLLAVSPVKERTAIEPPRWLWLVIEDPQGEEVHRDIPVSFEERRFYTRRVRRERISNPSAEIAKED